MSKSNKIIYWVSTLWLSLGCVSTGIVQIIRVPEEVAMMTRLGYPDYVMTILGIWKILAVVALLIPKFPLLKEWAYAGLFFNMTGAIISHFAVGDPKMEFFGPSLLLILTATSWYFRPADRKILLTIQQ